MFISFGICDNFTFSTFIVFGFTTFTYAAFNAFSDNKNLFTPPSRFNELVLKTLSSNIFFSFISLVSLELLK